MSHRSPHPVHRPPHAAARTYSVCRAAAVSSQFQVQSCSESLGQSLPVHTQHWHGQTLMWGAARRWRVVPTTRPPPLIIGVSTQTAWASRRHHTLFCCTLRMVMARARPLSPHAGGAHLAPGASAATSLAAPSQLAKCERSTLRGWPGTQPIRPCDASMLSTTTTSPCCRRMATEWFQIAPRIVAIVSSGIVSPSA
jgi:hypothetical protein